MGTTIVENGVSLMIYGMGMVFIFLTVLILCTSVMSQVILKFFPEAVPVEPQAPTKNVSPHQVSPRTLQIIQAALEQHRSAKR